jgi:hypothetical protein
MKSKIEKSSNKKCGERVIFLWSVPANGHLNPTLCFTNQLLLRLDEMNVKKIIFYSEPSFAEPILNLPNNANKERIEFREYKLKQRMGSENLLKMFMDFDTSPGTLFRMFQCFENALKLGSKHLFANLLNDMHRDKPILILYDQALFFPKLALSLYEKKYACPKPLHCQYVTTFMCSKGVYPYWSELEKMGLLGKNDHAGQKCKNLAVTGYDLIKFVFMYYKTLWWNLGFSMRDLVNARKCEPPLSHTYLLDDCLNLVFVMPEVQPRLESFQAENIKFVGSCIDESARSKISNKKCDMDKYMKMIDEFLEKNLQLAELNHSKDQTSSTTTTTVAEENNVKSVYLRSESTGDNFKKFCKPIIYVSMGTVFNNENSDLFKVLVNACKFYSKEYAIIVSTGDEKTYKKYADSELNNGSILFVPHTPQVEILKRANLFITHAGMNSVNEAIHYGVPIICLPLR